MYYSITPRPTFLKAVFIIAFTGISILFSGKSWAQTNPVPQPIPYAQDFGNDFFSVLPAGFAAWNALGAPISSTATALSNGGKSDQSVDTAQVPKTVGDVYGYSGITSRSEEHTSELQSPCNRMPSSA